MNKDLGVWTAQDCAVVLIDYLKEMLEVIRSENRRRPGRAERPAAGQDGQGVRHAGRRLDSGIRVNSIWPGLIASNATRGQLENRERASEMRGRTLLGRLGQPEDVANVALFPSCAESSYLTGIDVAVDGGMKVW